MKSFLPHEFRFAHHFALFHHDLLVETLSSGEEADIFSVQVDLKRKEHFEAIKKLENGAILDWLYSQDYKADVLVLLYKQVCVAALSDFCHFIFMALKSSSAAKTTVAYSLFRKPFKDNLFLLEWLLGEPTDFIPKFYFEEPERYEPSRVSEDRKMEIINSAVSKTKFSSFYDSRFIYEMRYNKQNVIGFEPMWNKAMHIVTSYKTYKTERQNLNFIFSTEDNIYNQWNHIYSFVPYLLFYAYDIVDALVLTFAKRKDSGSDMTDVRRLAGFLLWSDRYYFYEEQDLNKLRIAWEELTEDLDLVCPECSEKNAVATKRNLEAFYKHGKISCKSCRTKFTIDSY